MEDKVGQWAAEFDQDIALRASLFVQYLIGMRGKIPLLKIVKQVKVKPLDVF